MTTQRPPHFLTPAEDAMLRLLYPDTSTADLAAEMGLTADQISNYAKTRRLRKSAAYKAAQKAKTIARLTATRREAYQRKIAMLLQANTVALRIQASPPGTARRTAHGAAYTDGHITVHVML
jgi:hypothetical protein